MPIILDEGNDKVFTGKLKFFNESENFGFIVN